MGRWQLQEAKQQFSRLVDRARSEGPQVVTRHGKEVAVVIAVEDYRRLNGDTKSFWEFLTGPPYVDVDLPIDRSKELPREIDFSE
jgi:antitoxin Phd